MTLITAFILGFIVGGSICGFAVGCCRMAKRGDDRFEAGDDVIWGPDHDGVPRIIGRKV